MWLWLWVMVGCASQASPGSVEGADSPVSEEAAPRVIRGDTRLGAREVDRYDCAPRASEAGPELRYVVELDEPGVVFADLTTVEEGTDVDVHLISAGTCVARGDTRAAAWLEAGRHEVVVDTWVDAGGRERPGSFELTIGVTGINDHAAKGLAPEVLSRGLRAWSRAWSRGETTRSELTVVDFARSSDQDRFFTVDLATGELVFSLLTTHGDGSADPQDYRLATTFSNTPGSYQSSLGLMKVGESYTGSFGFSARMDGLEPHNAKVRERFIVIHPHASASRSYAEAFGGAGPSLGCLMLDPAVIDAVVKRLRGGTLVWNDFAAAPEVSRSAYLD